MRIVTHHELMEEILAAWRNRIADDFPGYRGHAYRVFNFCLALQSCSEEKKTTLAIAACHHDIGLWSTRSMDYIPPSVAEVMTYLSNTGRQAWSAEMGLVIQMHHKIRSYSVCSLSAGRTVQKGGFGGFLAWLNQVRYFVGLCSRGQAGDTQRIRLDRASEASHELNRLVDEPGPGARVDLDYENSFWEFMIGEARQEQRAWRKRRWRPRRVWHWPPQPLAEAKTQAVEGEQEHPVAHHLGGLEQSPRLRHGEDVRQTLGFGRLDQVRGHPRLAQHRGIEELQAVQVQFGPRSTSARPAGP